VQRYRGNAGVRALSCAEQFRAMAFAQLTWRESLRDIEVSLSALDSTTIDLCLSLFDWAPFRSTKAAVKLHTLLDLRGAIPTFIHISDGKLKTQIWCAVATYVLIAIVKKELDLDALLYTCLQILSVSVFEKTEISCALRPDRPQTEPHGAANQLILFDF